MDLSLNKSQSELEKLEPIYEARQTYREFLKNLSVASQSTFSEEAPNKLTVKFSTPQYWNHEEVTDDRLKKVSSEESTYSQRFGS